MFHRYFAFLERRILLDKLLIHLLLIGCIVPLFFVFTDWSVRHLVTVPTSGGVFSEGIVGTPRFVNPVLATTRVDRDISALVYSGLMKISPTGELVPDIAESVVVSDDGRTYTITLKQNQYFHNGQPVTARDVAFTIGLIQNADLKSPLRGNWDGVLLEERGEYELTLVLEEAYTPFIENLTVGILPRDLWSELPSEQLPFSQYNTEPIGSGPYAIERVHWSDSGLIEGYTFKPSPFYTPAPNIETIEVTFYRSADDILTALNSGDILATPSLLPQHYSAITALATIVETPLPRTFALYYNQNRSAILRDQGVRQALAALIDRDVLTALPAVTGGIPITTPVPAGFGTVQSVSSSTANTSTVSATEYLTTAGWTKDADGNWEFVTDDGTIPLSVTLSTANSPFFDALATEIAARWSDAGIDVTVNQYEQTDLVQAIIRPRDYEILLFGNDVSRSLDYYPYWHSSQRDDPGLNIVQYANIDTDALLEIIRTSPEAAERDDALAEFVDIIAAEEPVTFLFTPTFSYVVSESVTLSPLTSLAAPHERFASIENWYVSDEIVWSFWPWSQ